MCCEGNSEDQVSATKNTKLLPASYIPAIAAPPARSGLPFTLGGRLIPPGPYPACGLAARPGGSRLDGRPLGLGARKGVIALPLGLGARKGVISLPRLPGLGARKGVSARPAGLGARLSLLLFHDGLRCSGGRGSCGDAPTGGRLAEDGLAAAANLRGRIFEPCSSLLSQVFGFKSMTMSPVASTLTT